MRKQIDSVRAAQTVLAILIAGIAVAAVAVRATQPKPEAGARSKGASAAFEPRRHMDCSGFGVLVEIAPRAKPGATFSSLAKDWDGIGFRLAGLMDEGAQGISESPSAIVQRLMAKSMLLHYEGGVAQAEDLLAKARRITDEDPQAAARFRYSVIYFQGVTALRRGENDNCVNCRGRSACILPISAPAVHQNPNGSKAAIGYFEEYLTQFPDDLEVHWLLNLAHMTLGSYPGGVPARYRIPLDRLSEINSPMKPFADVSHKVGLDRINQAGGSILDDFTGDGFLDLVVTSMFPGAPMALYQNKGGREFADITARAGLAGQLGGLNCVQTDFDNDGLLDIFVTRGAWLLAPMRPSLLRNNGDGTFADVTQKAGLAAPLNSISSSWCDYDNDGDLDLFVCCEQQASRLYRNKGNGSFEEVSRKAGIITDSGSQNKASAWIDFDNDDYPDLFLNNLAGDARFFRNNRDGTFTETTHAVGIDGPKHGFSCWSWDYDNDGFLDLLATSYDRSVADVVQGLLNKPHGRYPNKLFRNIEGKRFEDVTDRAGLNMVFAAMGSNFSDFDGDGYLDFYLGTGEPSLATLIPNRMFRNRGSKDFAEVTGNTGTGHLQKGHGVACGDWDRDGDIDLFIETGGAANGDRYHNLLFQNPGHGNSWLSLKTIGVKSNRQGIGARVKVVTDGPEPRTIHRVITSGSSFGANALHPTIGLGKATTIRRLEIHWPTSRTTQLFTNVPINSSIAVKEFAKAYTPRREPAFQRLTAVTQKKMNGS